jgi:hypothetical protein
MRNVGSTLDTQRLANELYAAGQEMKSMITVTRAPIITPENFLNQARKALDGELPFKKQEISQEVFDVIQAAYQKTPWLLNGLRLSVRAPKTQGRVTGNFSPYARIVKLWSGTSGTEDPSVARHELAHSMEQMMTPAQRSLVIDAWMKDLDNRIKKSTDPKEMAYFQAV